MTETEVRLPHNGWRARPHQREAWDYLRCGGKRLDVAAHRRWGKDEVALHWAAIAAAKKPADYWHMLPEQAQGRKAIWEATNPHTGRRRIDEAFPPAMIARRRDDEMMIRFKNGASWRVVGSDNYDSLVGSPPAGIVFSEWSLAKPEAWAYFRPILAENDGWAVFLWTPRGRNHATQAFEARAKDLTWRCIRSPATQTNVFTPDQLERERAELIAELGSKEEGEARFASEYLVDFDVAVPGSYYGSLIGDAQAQGRIMRVPYDPQLKVDTAWDLGIDDYTAIWFLQRAAREVRAIGYFEVSGLGLQAIVREAIANKPWVFGTHYLPHDVAVRELGNGGKSRLETLQGLGLINVSVGSAMDPEDRINAGRQMIPVTYFDREACALGIDRLRQYRKRWVKGTRSYAGPLHDENSHGADAWGEYAANAPPVTTSQRREEHRRAVVGSETGWMGA